MGEMKNFWGYDNLYDNCYKFGKIALVAIPLENAWKLSQTMHPTLPHSSGDCLDLYWCIWSPDGSLQEKCAPFALENCTLVIPSSESIDVSQIDCPGLL
jgi:hypothetical protein